MVETEADVPPHTVKATPDSDRIWVFTWNEILGGVTQFVSLIAAFVFGVWAVKSFDAAEQANALAATGISQAIIANQLALISLCMSQPSILNSTACNEVLAIPLLPGIATALNISLPPTTSLLPTSTSTILFTSSTTLGTSAPPETTTAPPATTPPETATTPTETVTTPETTTAATETSTPAPSTFADSPRNPSTPSLSTKRPLSLGAIIGIVAALTTSLFFLLVSYVGLRRSHSLKAEQRSA